MRVLHLLHSLRRGGLEGVVVSVANGLSRRGIPQAVCCLHETGPLASALDAEVALFSLGARPNAPTLPFKLRRVYQRFRPDVVETVDFCSWPEATLAATVRRMKRSHVFHGFLGRPPLRWRLAGRVLARLTHHLAAVSASLADQAAETYRIPRARIEVAPNGVDVDRFDPRSSGRAESPRDLKVAGRGLDGSARFTCVTVASLTPAKNPLLLVDVARQLGPSVHFVWVGDGPLREEFLRRIDASGLRESFTLGGAVADVGPYLAAADAFVLPSLSEAAPMAVLEAMATRLPIIATRVGDLPGMVEPARAGVLVETGDAAALAAAIQRIRMHPQEAQQMGVRGRDEVRRRFSLERMLDAYQRTYEQLCNVPELTGRLSSLAVSGAG